MVAGMLDLPVAKFGWAELDWLFAVAAVLFPAGHSAGAAIDIPSDMQSGDFKWLLLATALLLWVGGWLLCWRPVRRSGKSGVDRLTAYFPAVMLHLAPLTLGDVGVIALVVLVRHPLMPVYIDILRKVVGY